MNLYQLLGVDASADAAELARAYRRRLRQLHPDVRDTGTGDPEQLDQTLDLAAVQHAYRVLRDPATRARYDAELRAPAARTPPGAPVPIPVRRRRARPEGPLIRVGRVRVDPLPRRRQT